MIQSAKSISRTLAKQKFNKNKKIYFRKRGPAADALPLVRLLPILTSSHDRFWSLYHVTLSLSASTFSPIDQASFVNVIPLLHRVDSAIQKSPHLAGRHLVLETRNGSVVLRGTVDSYFEKQMAQEALRTVEGITEIHNQLEVAYGKRK